ncbi:MAG TPA: 2Fe-2S iron-sulfur cluster binding domain-containing protein [Stellaceae bacterium]|nr:2Fe-2S iron-sulfur cluster binding domain-containing protein [Stellaceae bacterium]
MSVEPREIIVHLGNRVVHAPHREGDTVLSTLRRAEIPIATQCEQAYCGTCIFQLLTGEVRLRINDVLGEADLATGLRLACQGVPEGETVEIELL